VDECRKKGICEGKCINTVGSYRCKCPSGLSKGRVKNTCEDIDECARNNGGCEHLCRNTHGSYFCKCKKGYERSFLNPKYCNDRDECQFGVPNCHTCINVPGG
ncbi:signal peptide, CUB and EGF-like domain-containing 3 isoform X1, partial [Paramuricea clavata]